MAISLAPPVPEVGLSLSLGERVVDLATRALVVAVVPPPRWAREAEVVAGVRAAADTGADLVEVPPEPRLVGPAAQAAAVPIAARVTTPDAAAAATIAGATVLLVPSEHVDDVTGDERAAGWQVVVLVEGAKAAQQAVLTAPARIAGIDVTRLSGPDAVSEESLALSVGARLVRTSDVRRTRRVVEVMAALLGARSPAVADEPRAGGSDVAPPDAAGAQGTETAPPEATGRATATDNGTQGVGAGR